MARKRSRLLDYAAYVAVRSVSFLMLMLPVSWSLAIGRAMARLAFYIDRRHRNVAIDNLRRSFPGQYSEQELRDLALGVYRHFAKMLLEMLLIPSKLPPGYWKAHLPPEDIEPLVAAEASGRPLIILTAHYGNWELAAFMLTDFGVKAHLVARPLDNPYLDELVRNFRESRGHTVLTKQGSASDLLTILQNGGKICTLADQDAGEQGLFVDFFGRPASTHRAVANLALRTGALIVVVGLQNLGGVLDYAVRVTDVIDPREYHGPVPKSLLAITQRLTKGVETLVRFDPRQYLWLHRRWKTLPLSERPAQAA